MKKKTAKFCISTLPYAHPYFTGDLSTRYRYMGTRGYSVMAQLRVRVRLPSTMIHHTIFQGNNVNGHWRGQPPGFDGPLHVERAAL